MRTGDESDLLKTRQGTQRCCMRSGVQLRHQWRGGLATK